MAKYQQVVDWVQSRLSSRELHPGAKLESENEISEMFQIRRQTVRHALKVLHQEGIIVTRQGSGTYIRNPEDDSNVWGVSRTINIISTYVDSYIFPRIIQSMGQTLGAAEYGINLMFTQNQLEAERKILRRILAENSREAIIAEPVMSGLPNPNAELYRRLQDRGIPILFFHSFYPELTIPHIIVNDSMAGQIAAEYLLSQGHRNIAAIFKVDDGQGMERYKGYLKALMQADIPVNSSRVIWIDTETQRNLSEIAPWIVKRMEGCTACVCYNDDVAHSLTAILQENHLRIPEDISLVSIDNSELASLNSVSLTSVSHPMEKLGRKVAENMLRLLSNPGFDANYEFTPELTVRESVCVRGAEA